MGNLLVEKRDGRIVPFDLTRIVNAIYKAADATNEFSFDTAQVIAEEVLRSLQPQADNAAVHVEVIQNTIEQILMRKGFYQTAKAFILYREKRRQAREYSKLLDVTDLLGKYIGEETWEVHENANIGYSIQGLKAYITGKAEETYWLEKIYPEPIAKMHREGMVHIHNLSFLGSYCVGWDLEDLLRRGFGGVAGKTYSKPAKHLSSALGQMMNFLFTLQNETAGAVAFSSFDTLLAPFVRFDGLSYYQLKQELQEFVFNMNQTMRTGGQSPFSNITLDLTPHPLLKDRRVIYGGEELQNYTYSMFQKEMELIDLALFEVYTEGDGNGRPFTFPIPTINITSDFDWDNPVLAPVWEATAKYGIPYFANFVNSDLSVEDARSMCLDQNEEIYIKDKDGIKRLSIGEVANQYRKDEFDSEGWADSEESIQALSLNPDTLRLEWSPIKRFFRVIDNVEVEITTEDGKSAIYSKKHPIPIYTPDGIKMKFASDIQPGDYLLTLKQANENVFSHEYRRIDETLILDEDLAKILGYFVANGNYLFESRKNSKYFKQPRGMQFSFRTGDEETISTIEQLIREVFKIEVHKKQDPRYNSFYMYVYSAELARRLFDAGFKKYGRLPQILFDSPKSVIESFLDFYFKGDGYKKRQEIHINDLELSRDLTILYSMVGKPVTYKLLKNSQRIRLQHSKAMFKNNGLLNNPTLSERLPSWLSVPSKVPGLTRTRTTGIATLDYYEAHVPEGLKIKNSDIYLVRVASVKTTEHDEKKTFYDIELKKNHLFVHSLGQISFNCCRLRLNTKELRNKGGGLFGASPLTGSIGVITINLPRIAYLSNTEEEFFSMLNHVMDKCRDGLEAKRKTLEKYTAMGLYPYSRIYLEPVYNATGQYWNNHFSTIGIVGMNEALMNFFGTDVDMGTEKGIAFAVKVLNFMRNKLVQYQEETEHMYNLEATPAESTSYSLALKDKELFPDIITSGTEDTPYYTNSTQLPVNYTDDPIELAQLQEPVQVLYTGGTVVHFFLGERISGEATKNFVKLIFNNFRIPYITLTPTFSICPKHGYIAGEHEFCPLCDEELVKNGVSGSDATPHIDIRFM